MTATLPNGFKPLLFPIKNPDLETLKYPIFGCPKLNGMRMISHEGTHSTRALKQFANKYLMDKCKELGKLNVVLDGEIIVGEPYDIDVYENTQHVITSADVNIPFTYWVFDVVSSDDIFEKRLEVLQKLNLENKFPWIKYVPYVKLSSTNEIEEHEEFCLKKGFEGLILRDPSGIYKFGRATPNEGIGFKVKRFEDTEATIEDYLPLMKNENTPYLNELGYSKRSSVKNGLVELPMVGTIIGHLVDSKKPIKVGSGIPRKLRQQMWNNKDAFRKKIFRLKHYGLTAKGELRHTSWIGFRDAADL